MLFWALSFFLFASMAFAEVGKVSKILGPAISAQVKRSSSIMPLNPDFKLEVGDELLSNDSVVLVHIYPTTQLSLAKNSQIKITKTIVLVKGLVSIQVTKKPGMKMSQRIDGDGIAFDIKEADFELSTDNENYDLNVTTGEVEVSSPYVQTFVPEFVKAKEGFRFNKKARLFERRKYHLKGKK